MNNPEGEIVIVNGGMYSRPLRVEGGGGITGGPVNVNRVIHIENGDEVNQPGEGDEITLLEEGGVLQISEQKPSR